MRPFLGLVLISLILMSTTAKALAPFGIDTTTYYSILGVEQNATEADIKKAYHKAAKKYHPDVLDDPRGVEALQLINEAKEVLLDSNRRSLYDQRRSIPGYDWERFSPGRAESPRQAYQPPPNFTSTPGAPEFAFLGATLADFTFQEMLDQAPKYTQFKARIAATIMQEVFAARNPFAIYSYDGIRLRAAVWTQNPVLGLILAGGAIYLSAKSSANPELQGLMVTTSICVSLALEECLIKTTEIKNGQQSSILSSRILSLIQAWKGRDTSVAKEALFNYDVAEIIARSTLTDTGPYLYLTRLKRILRFFPHTYHGLLLRTLRGGGSQLEALSLDFESHPLLWQKVVTETLTMVGPNLQHIIRSRLPADFFKWRPLQAVGAEVTARYRRTCERWLSRSPN